MSKGSSRCFQPTAKAQSRRLPVESAMPGTTLQTIELKAFASGGALFGESTILSLDALGRRALLFSATEQTTAQEIRTRG